MLYLKTSMILTDDRSEPIPLGLDLPTFVLEGNTKDEILKKLAYHLELCHAVLEKGGVDGYDYKAIARKRVKRVSIKRYE